MATVPPPPQAPPPQRTPCSSRAGRLTSSDALIAQRIMEAQAALWRAELSRSLLIPVVVVLASLTLWAVVDHWIWSPGKFFRSIALAGGVAWLAAWIARRVWPLMSRQILPEYAAHSLEHDLPELRHSLTSYVSLREDHDREGVRGVVVRSIGVRAAGQLQSHEIEIPSEATGNFVWWLGVAGAIAMAA
ncbi:MAG: circumsporozoite protein-membrane associated protein, partial [Planctomycetaceae bacterium]